MAAVPLRVILTISVNSLSNTQYKIQVLFASLYEKKEDLTSWFLGKTDIFLRSVALAFLNYGFK